MSRLDVSTLIDALRRTAEAALVEPHRTDELVAARLYDFTSLLFGHELLAKTCADIQLERRQRIGGVEDNWRATTGAAVRGRLEHILGLVPKLFLRIHTESLPGNAPSPLRTRVEQATAWWKSAEPVLTSSFKRIADGTTTEDDFEVIRAVLAGCPEGFRDQLHGGYRDVQGAGSFLREIDEVAVPAREITEELRKSQDGITRARAFVKEAELGIIDDLRQFHERALRMLAGTADFRLREHEFPIRTPNFHRSLPRLVEVLVARLSMSPARAYVVGRLKTYFEAFGRDDLLKRLAERGKAKQEDIIQTEVEKFVFFEGLYPLVHSEAARGKTDLVIERAQYGRGMNSHPLLIELKQVVDLADPRAVTMKEVLNTVADGRKQRTDYERSLKTASVWEDIRPFLVVFYNSRTRLDIEYTSDDDVVLVYIGDGVPSAPRPVKQ